MYLIRHLVNGTAVLAATGGWIVAFVAHHHGSLGTVLLVCIGVALLAVLGAVVLGFERWARSVEEAEPDALAPWRDHRVVSGLSLCTVGEQDVTLRLVLARELGDQKCVVVEFRAVSGLQLQQFGGWAVSFSRLRARELRSRGERGPRYEVRDEDNDTIRFRCRAIERVPTDGRAV